MYEGTSELFEPEAVAFAAELRHDHLAYRLNLYAGVHGYSLWSAHLADELSWLSGGEHC